MSEENKKTQSSEEQKDAKAEEKKEEKEIKEEGEVSAPEEKTKEVSSSEESSNTDSEEKDFASEDDDLPEDIKKKLEKKKTEKDARKSKKVVKKKKKKKVRGKVESGKIYIKATYNNTIVTFADEKGEIISWASAGVAGFKGPKKSTPYAAQIITKIACLKAKQDYGFKNASVFVKGVGMGRESAIRTLNAQGIFIDSIKDTTPIPHNGCRPRKPRRV